MKDTDSRLASKVYKLYAEFFDKAEQERRWNPYRDIPWDRVNRDATEELALCAETFFAVESYLPDYVAQGINIVRESFGQTWFSANWGYEESKHSIALMEYLMRSGKRTEEQMFDFHDQLKGLKWELPFTTAESFGRHDVSAESLRVDVTSDRLRVLSGWIDGGGFPVPLGEVLPLRDAILAHRKVEGLEPKAPGHLVLRISD